MSGKDKYSKKLKIDLKNNKQHRIVAIAAAVLAVGIGVTAITLASCQKSTDFVEESIPKKYTTMDGTVQHEEGFHYKITDTAMQVYPNGLDGVTYYSGWTEVTNTGTTNILLDTAKFYVCDKNNTVIQTDDYIPSMPQILLPGEKGYWYFSNPLGSSEDEDKWIKQSNELTLKPEVQVYESEEKPARLSVSNDTMTKKEGTVYHFSCDVKNTFDHTVYFQYLNVWHLLYKDGKLIGRFCMDSTDKTLEPGETKTFTYDFDTSKLPGQYKGSDITDYKILAMEELPK